MRPIDADRLLKMMSHWKPYMDMDNVRDASNKMPTLTPSNEPLTCDGCRYIGQPCGPCNSCIGLPLYEDYYSRPPKG